MLTIETNLPIEVVHGDTSSGAIAEPAANLRLLRALNLLALGGRNEFGDSQSSDWTHDIARLEAKIDILVSMLGLLIAEKSLLPPVRMVCFNAESIAVKNLDADYRKGDLVSVTLYPSTELPRALNFAAVVIDNSDAEIRLDLTGMGAVVRDEFERYIFLRHRREHAEKPEN